MAPKPSSHICDPEGLREIAKLLDDECIRHNQQMELIKRKILLEAGLVKTPAAPVEFEDFKGRKRKIVYRQL